MAKAFFITGIDTDAGKTVVTAGLLRYLRNKAINTIAMKPVQTGCETIDGKLTLPDFDVYQQAVSLDVSDDEINTIVPYRYELASSPHLAAEEKRNYPDLNIIEGSFKKLQSKYELVLVEGAGGLLVPLDDNKTMLDMTKLLAIPILIVVDNRLGMINHSLLTVEVLKQHKLDISGFILTNSTLAETAEAKLIRQSNTETIARMSGLPVLAEIPFIKDFDITSDTTWNMVEAIFDEAALMSKLGL